MNQHTIPIKVPVVRQAHTPVTDDEVHTPPLFSEDDLPAKVMALRTGSAPFRHGTLPAEASSPWRYCGTNNGSLVAYLRLGSAFKAGGKVGLANETSTSTARR